MIRYLIQEIIAVGFLCFQTLSIAQDNFVTINLDEIPTVPLRPTRIIDDGGEPLFSNIVTIAYDPYENKIYLGDIDEITVLSPDGKVLKKVGRRGKGPGEFGWISRIDLNEEHIFVADKQNARVQIFNKDFSYARSVPANGAINDVTFIDKNQLIIHTSASRGYILHKYDIETPYRPTESFLEVMPGFDNIAGNILSINAVNLAANDDCLYVLYKALPILRKYCNDSKNYQEVRFAGNVLDFLYEKLPAGISSSRAGPVKIIATRILVDTKQFIYWMTVSGEEKKLFMFGPSLKIKKAFLLQLPKDVSIEKHYIDFSIVHDSIYVCNIANGTIQVYDHKFARK